MYSQKLPFSQWVTRVAMAWDSEPNVTPPSPNGEALAHAGMLPAELGVAADECQWRMWLLMAVTIKENILVLNVKLNRKSMGHGFLVCIFETLDRFGIMVDLISMSKVHSSMTIKEGLSNHTLEHLVQDLE